MALWMALWMTLNFSHSVQATPPDNWEVMRVFISDDPEQISRLVTSHYATVLLDDLARELAEHSDLRKVSPLKTPALEEAIYVARLEGENIISDQSRWKLSGSDAAQPVELGSVSLALRTARGISTNSLQLADYAQFSPTGAVELPLVTNQATYWFGFSINSKEQAYQRVFNFRIPPAVTAKLLLATPANVELNSPTLVVEKIPSLANQLPEDWSVSSMPSSNNTYQWWLVHLSGISDFNLAIGQSASTNLTTYKHLVRTAVIDYVGNDSQLEARANFVVAGHQVATPLRLQVDRQFKIETVLADGQPVLWRAGPSLTDDATLIELLELKTTSQNINLEIRATCPPQTASLSNLPRIAVAESYAMDGKCRLAGRDGWVADTLIASGLVVKRVPRGPATAGHLASDSTDEPLMWETSWLGKAPQLQAGFSRQRQPSQARSLTRFSIQAEWLTANCRMRIDAPHLLSNEIRLPVGNGWFIDSVRLIGTESDFRARVEDREEAASPMIVIHWEGNRRQLAIELEVIAHSPREMNADSISLRSPRLVTLPQADQIDNYVIEPTSRFTVQVGSQLLPYQRQAFELPVWQQTLLQPATDMWVFQGVRGNIPPITLIASSGTFTSQVLSVVRRKSGALVLLTHIRCTPTSGSIDRVRLAIPASSPAEHWQWSLHQPDEVDESVPLRAFTIAEIESDTTAGVDQVQTIELELPSPLSGPFVLTSELTLEGAPAELHIPVLGVPAATGGESTLLLPRDLASGLDRLPVELLATSMVRAEQDWSDLLDEVPREPAEAWVAARMDASLSQVLRIKPTSQTVPAGWAWSELLQHTIRDNGQVDHDIQWVIEGTRLEPLKVKLPEGWWVEHVWVDGIAVDSPQLPQTVQLELPRYGRTTVALRCASRHEPPRWLSYQTLPRPELSLPILATRATLAIPPTRLAAGRLPRHWLPTGTSLRLVDRLLPTTLWSLLAPTSADSDSGIEEQDLKAGWSIIELSNERRVAASPTELTKSPVESGSGFGEWIISRSALSALALAFVLSVASVLWSWLGSSPRQWWLVATVCVVGVVLVPGWLLAPAQLVLLALSLAALLRLCAVVTTWRHNPLRPRGRSSILLSPPSASTTSVVILICLCGWVHGQSTTPLMGPFALPAGTSFENNANGNESKSPSEIFSVLIPLDDTGAVAGAYAYAPTRLLELLAGGGDWSTRTVPPKILSADYTLRMRRGMAGGPDQVQELSVEFRLQVAQADVEIRLPFTSSQVQLQRGNVAGQELFVGGRWLNQLPDAVVFRANSVGSLRLQLQFEPRDVTASETQASLRCAIPPIPNATLRIVADSSSAFEVRSSGTGRKTISSVSTELLGPTSELQVQWSPTLPRATPGQVAAEVYADTWLHARGEQVSAICQLRIENARALSRDLHIVAEPGWEPVGTSWADGELVASELSALGGRRVYTLRGHDDWDQLSRRVLRVLMVPRDPEQVSALAIPFFTLREVSQQAVTRTLAWTTEEGAVWRPDGLDLWPELVNVPGLEWGALAWTARPQLYRLVGTLATTLRRVSLPATATIDEMTQVHMMQDEIKLNYRGQFTTPQPQPLALVIPRQARVDSVLVDGNPRNYRISERGQEALIEILPSEKPAAYRILEVVVSQPLALNSQSQLPRVFARGYTATRSLYRVLCGVGLECGVIADDNLSLETTKLPAHELLPALETLVGEVDLRSGFRETPKLPLEFKVRRRPDVPVESAVLSLTRSEQGWRATVTAVWNTGNTPLDFAFFELPATVRDSVDPGQLPYQLAPLGDSGRMTLRLLPAPPVAGKTEVKFEFSLPALPSNQTVSLPDIAVLSETPLLPLLALPNQVDGQTVQWTGVGRRVDEAPVGAQWGDEYQFFEIEPAQSQISWKRFETEARSAQLLLSHVTLASHQREQVAGYIDYWIAPKGQLNLSLVVPEQAQVLGVEVAEQPAIWSLDDSRLNVLLQPNYLPLNVRVLLHWDTPAADSLSLQLPRVLNATATQHTLEFVENRLSSLRANSAVTRDGQQRILREFSRNWAQLVFTTLQAGRTRPTSETLAWLEDWNPRVVGLSDNASIEMDLLTDMALALDAENSQAWSANSTDELWQRLWQLAQDQQSDEPSGTEAKANELALPSRSHSEFNAWPAAQPSQYVRLTSQQDVLVLKPVAPASGWTSRWMAAGLLSVSSLLALLLATRLGGGYLRLISSQPWVYWLQLAVIAWWLLPIAWPSWVVGATAVGMLISQRLETRRRQRLLARV